MSAPASTQAPASRSAADRIARWALRVEGAQPRALVPLQGSLLISAVRCVITYAVIPGLAPVVGWLGPLATPLSLTLSLVAIVMAVTSLRRVWLADWSGRWPYTAFAVTVVLALAALVVVDLRVLLA